VVVCLIAGGAIFLAAYFVHARHTAVPALDLTLFRLATFRASVFGGFTFRIGVGALPFLLPLMLQVGFGKSPFESGLITFASAAGAMGMKMAAATMLKRFGFRAILISNALISSAFLAACAFFTDAMPVALMFAILLVGGFFRSLQFTSINTIAYAEVEQARVSRATALVSVGQQLSLSAGVALGALAVDLTAQFHGHTDLRAADFQVAFFVVAAISAMSVFIFRRLSVHAGAELSGRAPPDEKANDGR